MTSFKLFEDDRIQPAVDKARKEAEKLGHRLSDFIDVKVKNASWCKSAGCLNCGSGVTVLWKKEGLVMVGSVIESSCEELSSWRRR